MHAQWRLPRNRYVSHNKSRTSGPAFGVGRSTDVPVSPSGSAEDIDLGAVFGYDGRVTFWCDDDALVPTSVTHHEGMTDQQRVTTNREPMRARGIPSSADVGSRVILHRTPLWGGRRSHPPHGKTASGKWQPQPCTTFSASMADFSVDSAVLASLALVRMSWSSVSQTYA